MERKPDFERAQERLEAWWHGEIIDRPPVTIDVRTERKAAGPPKHYATLRERWKDLEYILDRFEAYIERETFLAEAFPRFEPKMGPPVVASTFGCELEFRETTSWSSPVARSCREILKMKPDLSSEYWAWIRRATAASIERGRGRWITALPDLHTNGSLVSLLRGMEEFCTELADDPDAVRAACGHVTDFYGQIHEDLWAPIRDAGQLCTSWTPFLHRGRAYVTSCDPIIMISPNMFRELILPSIVREMRYLECNVFHLDGPGAVRHLDALLALPELNAVQFVYGAGNGPSTRWIEVYRRVQAAGKSVELLADDLRDARNVAAHLKPEGVWFHIYGENKLEDAEAFIRWVSDWAVGKK